MPNDFDWRESPDSRESFQGSRTEPLFLRIALRGGGGRGLKVANRKFEAIRANCSHIMKTDVFLRIDSRESREPPCRESPGHLRSHMVPENVVLPRDPPGIPTEFILSAIHNTTELHPVPLNFPNYPEFGHTPPNPLKFSGKQG